MVINGGSRSGLASYTGYLGWHLQRRDTNELVTVRELRGVLASDLTEALDSLAMMGAGAKSQRPLYHANIDWRHDEVLTEAQKDRAVDRLAVELGLADQPRLVVEHTKAGRAHLHAVFLRIDPATGKAISDSHNYRRHEIVARDLEREFGLERVQGAHIEREGIERPERTPEPYEFAQAARSGITPAEAKAELGRLWQMADTGQAFARALDDAGWTLARGDRRDVLLALDPTGEAHPINKRLTGLTAAEVRARLADIDAATLPGVDQAREATRSREREAVAAGPVVRGMEVAGASPEAIHGPSYEAAPEVPADFEARFGPSEPEAVVSAEPGGRQRQDPEPATSAEPEPSHQVDQLTLYALRRQAAFEQQERERAALEAETTPQHRQARPRPLEPFAGVPGRLEPEADPPAPVLDGSADAARRAMEELARTDPLGMAARHGFRAGDGLKSPEAMRREWASTLRQVEPEPVRQSWGEMLRQVAQADARTPQGPTTDAGGMEVAGASPEATHGPSHEATPEPMAMERGRLAGIIAAARDRLAALVERLDAAFGRVRAQVLQPEADPARPRPEGGRMDDNAAVILEAMKPPRGPEPSKGRSVADELLAEGRRRTLDAEQKAELERQRERSIWDEFKRPGRGPGEPTP